MRIFAIIAIFALAIGIALAQGYPSEFQGYLEPNMSIAVQTLNTSEGMAYLATIEGKEMLLIKAGEKDPVLETAKIKSLLEQNVIANSGYAANRNASIALMAAFNASRAAPEGKCAQYTGLDHLPCTDRESCVRAAQAVPQASAMVNAPGFWQAMQAWLLEQDELDAGMSSLDSALKPESGDSVSSSAIGDKMIQVRLKLRAFMNNSLYMAQPNCNTMQASCKAEIEKACTRDNVYQCFEYCPKTNLTQGWEAQEAAWAQVASRLATLEAQGARADLIAANAKDWLNYTEKKAERWSALKSELMQREARIAKRIGAKDAKWKDSAIEKDFAALQVGIAKAKTYADAGQFYRAIESGSALISSADAIDAKAAENDKKISGIESSMKSINLSIGALAANNASEAPEMKQAYTAIVALVKYPIEAGKLDEAAKKAGELETQALKQVARKSLGVGDSEDGEGANATDGKAGYANVSPAKAPDGDAAKKEAIDEAKKFASQAAAGASKDGKTSIPCPVPITIGLVLVIAAALLRQ